MPKIFTLIGNSSNDVRWGFWLVRHNFFLFFFFSLFTKLPWPGDSEGTFRSSSQAATCPSVYHTRWRLHTVPLIAERQAGKLWIPIFIVFGLNRPGIEPVSTASVADALSTRPLIGCKSKENLRVDYYLLLKYCRRQCALLPLHGLNHLQLKFYTVMQDCKRVLDWNCK